MNVAIKDYSSYKKKMRRPAAAIAPILTNDAVPAPVNTAGVGLVGEMVVLVAVLLVPFVG